MTSNYEHLPHSSSSHQHETRVGDIFSELDANDDGVIDREELSNYVTGTRSGAGRTGGSHGGYSYESSSYASGLGLEGSALSGRYQSSALTRSKSDYDVTAIHEAANYTANTNSAWSRYGTEVRGAGIYIDPNPQIVRRETPVGTQTFEQHIQIRLLRPPPVPAGQIIVKEVREVQPLPLPPLRIRQEEVAAVQLPPLILRERPPPPPDPVAVKTVIKKIAALPVPPRSVIIERYPAAPARPRDIIIERWLPYQIAGEQKTIVERAEEVRAYEEPRNVIIQYDTSQVRVVRRFERLDITEESPKAYLARYGEQLLDSESLLRHARAAGVVEDISVPISAKAGYHTSYLTSETSLGADAEAALRGVSSSYSTRTFTKNSSGGGLGGIEYQTGLNEEGGAGYSSASYESSSYSRGGGASSGFSRLENKL